MFIFAEPPRQQKPSIMQGMIPKTVEMLQRPPETNRRSASPHMKRDSKTRYEKDYEEINYRSLSERKRDGERISSESENSSLPGSFPGSKRMTDYYNIPRLASIGK